MYVCNLTWGNALSHNLQVGEWRFLATYYTDCYRHHFPTVNILLRVCCAMPVSRVSVQCCMQCMNVTCAAA